MSVENLARSSLTFSSKLEAKLKRLQGGFLPLWSWLIRTTCGLLLVIQSGLLTKNFALYLISALILAKPILSCIPKFRSLTPKVQKIFQWLFIVVTTSLVAWLMTYYRTDQAFFQTSTSYVALAIQVFIIILFVQLLMVMVEKFSARIRRKKQEKLNKKTTK